MPPLPLTPALQSLRAVLPQNWRLPEGFDANAYLALYPDLTGRNVDAGLHFLRHGRHEGRVPVPLQAVAAERALWAGDMAGLDQLVTLHALDGAEGCWAALALARVAAQTGDWAKAAALLGRGTQFDRLIGLPDAGFLATEMALRQGDSAQARARIAQLRAQFGPLRELAFLHARSALAQGDTPGWAGALAPLYDAAGVTALALTAAGQGPRQDPDFDRLTAATPGPATPGPAPATDAPCVSVIVPARNAAATLDTALTGLLAQSWPWIEVLVVVNGSTDGTAERVHQRSQQDSRIRLLHSPAAAGAYGARNAGVRAATGAYVTVHDADDWSHPERLARQVARLAQADRPAGCLPHWLRVTPDLCPAHWRADVRMIHPCLAGLMVPRAVIDRLGPWDEVRAGADSEFLDRLRHVCGAGSVAQVLPGLPLALGRVLPMSLSQAPDTGLLGPGAAARTEYLAAARAWHVAAGQPVMPDKPHSRPFPVPLALALPQPEADAP